MRTSNRTYPLKIQHRFFDYHYTFSIHSVDEELNFNWEDGHSPGLGS